MAKKSSTQYVCSGCGASYPAWSGRCVSCGEWNTLLEETVIQTGSSAPSGNVLKAAKLGKSAGSRDSKRLRTHIDDIDKVLGGGLVPGSVVLIAGEPGIGKSTLLLQAAAAISSNHNVLYISGEESLGQINLRAQRLGIKSGRLEVATSTSADDIAQTMQGKDNQVVIVDSIQTISTQYVSSQTGSVSQITNSANLLLNIAKNTGTALVLVGHVTKEGNIAGPKVLEHVVDVVLQLEGERYGGFKLLRCAKNRFGSTQETGIFEMADDGMVPVKNPSAALLAERQVTDGSVVCACMEGNRPLLVEVQALVNKTPFGYPKRTASGIDLNRLNLLVAVLQKRTKLNLADYDVYVNIIGGIKISEPAADLAVCMAIGSAAKGLKLSEGCVVFGEVGLSGEIRHVPFIEKRLAEAKKLGFSFAIGPKTRAKGLAIKTTGDVKTALNTFLKRN